MYAATFDPAPIDDTVLVAGASSGRVAAVYTSVGGTLNVARLGTYVGELPAHGELEVFIGHAVRGSGLGGLVTGTPIVGPDDPRLVTRQRLAEQLAALDPIDEGGPIRECRHCPDGVPTETPW